MDETAATQKGKEQSKQQLQGRIGHRHDNILLRKPERPPKHGRVQTQIARQTLEKTRARESNGADALNPYSFDNRRGWLAFSGTCNHRNAPAFRRESDGEFLEKVAGGAVRRRENAIEEKDFHVHGGIWYLTVYQPIFRYSLKTLHDSIRKGSCFIVGSEPNRIEGAKCWKEARERRE